MAYECKAVNFAANVDTRDRARSKEGPSTRPLKFRASLPGIGSKGAGLPGD